MVAQRNSDKTVVHNDETSGDTKVTGALSTHTRICSRGRSSAWTNYTCDRGHGGSTKHSTPTQRCSGHIGSV